MKVIHGGRGTGRTNGLILLSAKQGGYMVVHSHDEACRVHLKAEDMGLTIPFPLTFSEFLNGQYYGLGVRQLWIDNADALIQTIATTPIAGIVVQRTPV